MALGLPLLPFLHSPGRFADVINGITKITQDASIDIARYERPLQIEKIGGRFCQAGFKALGRRNF